MDINQIAALAGIVALRACGHPGKSSDAPAPIAGYALAFSAAVTGLAVASQSGNRPDQTDWTGAPTEQIAQALYSIARDGLIPGGIGDPSATAYIFKGKGSAAPTGRPSPRGRLVMARAAGCDVRALAIGKADSLTLDDSGDEGEDGDNLHESLADEDAASADVTASETSRWEWLTHALDRLSPREQKLIRRHFGLDGRGGQPLSHVADELCVSRERLRQIEISALRKLRHLLQTGDAHLGESFGHGGWDHILRDCGLRLGAP